MKIKFIAAMVLILALGINTTEAQNRRRSGEQNQFGQHDRRGGDFSRSDKRGYSKNDGDYRRNDRNYRSGRMSSRRYSREFRGHDRYNHHRSYSHKRHNRRHSF